nr:integrase core domain-containing protein [Vibrio gangliei]
MDRYIDYDNNVQIKIKSKGLTPVEYRNQPLQVS